MKKKDKFKNEPYFKGLTPNDVLRIAMLATEDDVNWKKYDITLIEIGAYKTAKKLSPYNDFRTAGMEYVQLSIPLKAKEPWTGYEFRIYEDGGVSFQNLGGIRFPITNPLQVYKMLLANGEFEVGDDEPHLGKLTLK